MQARPAFGKRGVMTPSATAPPNAAPAAVSRVAAAPVAEFSPALDMAPVGEADMKLAIGRNWETYRPVCENLGAGFPVISFDRAGLVFGVFWLVYRKQYAAFFVTLLTQTAIAYGAPDDASWLDLAINVLIAFTGKWWIARSAALMVAKTRSLGLSEAETERRIERQGGVSWVGPFIALVFTAALGAAIGLSRAPLHF